VARRPVRKPSFAKAAPEAAKGMLLGYARVLKGDEQTNALQSAPFARRVAGGSSKRPPPAGAGTGRSCTACSTSCARAKSRLSRSLKDVLHLMERIAAPGAASAR